MSIFVYPAFRLMLVEDKYKICYTNIFFILHLNFYHMKILIVVVNYGIKNDSYLNKVLENFLAWSYNTDIIVTSNLDKDLGPEVQVIKGYPTSDPRSLAYVHRSLFVEHVNDYDLFIYSEDDMLITQENFEAFLEVTSHLPEEEVVGFLRYETGLDNSINLPDLHGNFHWYINSLKHIEPYIFAQYSNKHSGAYILTQSQLKIAIDSGNYELIPDESGYRVLEKAASKLFDFCNLNKVICISQVDRFLIHHIPNKYVNVLGQTKEELDDQVKVLTQIASSTLPEYSLLKTETKLHKKRYNLSHQAKCDLEIVKSVSRSEGIKNILTVGGSTGDTEIALMEMGHKVSTIPLDTIADQRLKKKGIQTTLPNFDKALEELSSSKQQFDYIIFDTILQYIATPKECIKKFINLLDYDGKLIATFWNTKHSKFWNTKLHKLTEETLTPFPSIGNKQNSFD